MLQMVLQIKSTIKLELDHDADYITVDLNSNCSRPETDDHTACAVGLGQKVRYKATVTISEKVCKGEDAAKERIKISLKGLKGQTLTIDVECKECKCNDPGEGGAGECSDKGALGNYENRGHP